MSNLINKFNQIANNKSTYKCTVCNKEFSKPCLLQRHSTVHTSELPFKCSDCNKRYSQKSSLQRHQKHNHQGIKKYQCNKCQAFFAQRSNLLQHIERTHAASTTADKCFSCSQCSCIFTRLNALNRHKKAKHSSNIHAEDAMKAIIDDDLPVADSDALVQNVLAQLKQLQRAMTSTEISAATNSGAVKESMETPIAQTIVDEADIELVPLRDKLHANGDEFLLNVQRIRRADTLKSAYVCEFCAKEFHKSYNYIRHRRSHTRERPYKCTHCECCFSTYTRRRAHEITHKLFKARFTCAICRQNFHTARKLELHMSTHTETHTVHYACGICQAVFSSRLALSRHKHLIEFDEQLEMLKTLLPEPINVKKQNEHMKNKTITSNTVINQKECNQNASECRTNQHLEQFKKQDKQKCNICGRFYSSRSALLVHQRIHTNHKPYHCSQCTPERSFLTKAQLLRHQLCMHTNERNFQCHYCSLCFKTSTHCRSHMITHLKKVLNEGDNVTVPSAVTPTSDLLIIKEQSRDTRKPAEFIELQLLPTCRQHKHRNIQVTSMSNKPTTTDPNKSSPTKHSCHLCTKTFSKPSDLQRHQRTHSHERPYICESCAKSFALKSTLEEHQRTHQAERRNACICQVCGKTYASKKVLTVHLRLHTGARPFTCELCDKTFRTSGHRIAHMKTTKHVQQSEKNLFVKDNML